MKLMFGDYHCIPDNKPDQLVILNLNSYREGYRRVNLIPPFGLEYGDKNFDITYANYIMNNNNIFLELMNIVIPLYNGFDVFILTSEGDRFEFVAESLQKFLQGRYGLISSIVNDVGDLDYVDDASFNIYGVYNLDLDKNRYAYLYASMNPDIVKDILREENN